jgi:glutathione S-transferase
VLYLESTYSSSGSNLVPEEAAARAEVYQRVFEAANLHGAMRDVVYPKMRNLLKNEDEEKEWKEVKVEALKSELARWESYLTENDD